ncbi:hypothetical protein GF360_02895 [candidate division WWE3 bacterium]|nr:hypothetical protein [candidate division WWE3 bacterium]
MFEIKSPKRPKIQKMYKRAMKELCDFFELDWTRNTPKLFLVQDEETIQELWNGEAPPTMSGWTDKLDVYVIDRDKFKKADGTKYTKKEHQEIIRHELVHSFTGAYTQIKGQVLPDWLWEGLAMYLSGEINDKEPPKEFKNFLNHYNQDMDSLEVYEEAGFVIKHLIENYEKDKFLKLLKELKNIKSEDEFNKAFKDIYGFELNYENFN